MDGNGGEEETVSTTPEQCWRGCGMDEIHHYLGEFELDHVLPVRPCEQTHAVLHHFPIRAAGNEPPRPLKRHQKWDAVHVRLPCSTKSQYPVTAADGSTAIQSRWEMIEQALLRPITNSHELQAAILSYNTKYEDHWNFRALHRLFADELDESEAAVFFEDLLPRIIRLALRLPELVQAPIPLLKQSQSHSVSLTQEQISCLLANAFLCTFPRRNTLKRKSEYSTFPDINFNRLFQSSGAAVMEKIKCICHYFRRVCPTERDNANVPTGVVTFTRRSMHYSDMPKWAECDAPLGSTPLHITASGTIEDQGEGLLQVDFANKYLGGGVLGSGCVQEEIRFVICPELLVSKLFTECLRPTEALLMVGCERYSNYTGYAATFKWAGNHEDSTPRDSSRRRLTHIVAIDALAFMQPDHQYREELMLRELNKAYVGFMHTLVTPAPGIASGNWGCGAFGGEATLKALLQLMVCTVTKRPLVYYTFGNAELRDKVHRMHTFFIERNVRVKDLWATLRKFQAQKLAAKELYNFIYSCNAKEVKHSPNCKKTPSPPQTTPTNSMKEAAAASSSRTTSATCSSSGAAAIAPAVEKQKPLNDIDISQDLFAQTSSESDNENALNAPITIDSSLNSKCNNSQASSTARIIVSDDSEAEVVVPASTPTRTKDVTKLPTHSGSKSNNNNNNATKKSPETPSKKRGEPRQRTLLEMLDQCYTEGNTAPASKRHCLGKTVTKS